MRTWWAEGSILTKFLFGMFIRYQAVMTALQKIMTQMNVDAPFMVGIPRPILVDVMYGIPIGRLTLRNYYATAVPTDIIQASRGRRGHAADVRGRSCCP